MSDSSWISYVPYHIAQTILANPGANPVGKEQRLHVVAVFVDTSGFTAISESLSRAGKSGAEELTQILNSYFEPMIHQAETYGGIVVKFAGDAISIIFPYPLKNRSRVVRQALQCALNIQAQMERSGSLSTSVGDFTMTMKIGLAIGRVLCTSVGDPNNHLEYVVAGEVLDRCAEAEHQALKGEIVAHRELLQYAGNVQVSKQRGEYAWVKALSRKAAINPLTPLPDEISDLARSQFERYLHPVLVERLRENQAAFINEHRKVTVVFAMFSGFDYDHDATVSFKLQEYLLAVMQIVDRYGGYFSRADMGDKGSKYIILFGTPVGHEDDDERALRCALELIKLPHCPTHIGINTGFVFCGGVGSAHRQEYAAIGDTVNLAARLMQAAQAGQILTSETTRNFVSNKFFWQDLEPILVKGKSDLVPIAQLMSMREKQNIGLHEPAYELPMVGREQELALISNKIEHAIRGAGQIIGITAEAGMGKSRLNAEIISMAVNHGFEIYGGECQSYGTQMNYLVWRDVWRGFFAINPEESSSDLQAHVEAQLADIDPNLVQRTSLLGVLLGLDFQENELTRSFDTKLRKASLEALLRDCLKWRASRKPLLLVLEDCHWIDPLSRELLEFLARNSARLRMVLIVLYRPPERGQQSMLNLTHLPHFTELTLTEFSDQEAAKLIELKFTEHYGSHNPATTQLVELIQTKAQGNPFYIDEMINFLHDRSIDPQDANAFSIIDLPDSLYSLIISRIDQLTEDKKITLKVASVIGRAFRASWLWQIYPQLGAPDQVKQLLLELSQMGLTPLDKPDPILEFLFKHIITQEVAYESIAIATRAVLHEQIGQFLEDNYANDLSPFIDLLAFHYGQSKNLEKQSIYFRQAGDLAKSAYSNQIAIEYYQRLLPLLKPDDQARVLCDLGEVWQLVGKWTEAEVFYKQALALAEQEGELHTHARSQLLLGHLMWYRAVYAEALEWLEKARHGFEVIEDQHGLSQAIGRMGLVFRMQSEYDRAIEHFNLQIKLTTENQDKEGLAEAIGHLGNVYSDRREYPLALDCYERELTLANELGNRRESLYAIGNIGNVYEAQGNYAHAMVNLGQVLDLAFEIGDNFSAAIAALNLGEAYRVKGSYGQAIQSYLYCLNIALQLDDRVAISCALANMAQAHLAQHQFDQAKELFAKAIPLTRSLEIPYYLAEFLYGQTELFSLSGDLHIAFTLNTEVMEVASKAERQDILLKARLLAIRMEYSLGKFNVASVKAALAELQTQATNDDEHAIIAFESWQLTKDEDQRHRAIDLYHRCYALTPNIEYYDRLSQLTNDALETPPTLAALPNVIDQASFDIVSLISQVDVILASLQPAS